ncbi:hypothetical protein PoB_005819200, partial [Plakobranchus ocellatus]
MVTYGNRVYSEDSFGFTANTDKNSLEGAINMMPYRSGVTTETGMAIKHVFVVGGYKMLDDIMVRLAYETCG